MLEEFHTFVKPKVRVQSGVPHNLKGGTLPFEKSARKGFLDFIEKHRADKRCLVAAHNGRRYDHRILHFHGFKPPLGVEFADSLDWFKAKLPGRDSYALGKIYQHLFSVPIPAAHNALPDVYAIFKCMKAAKCLPEELTSEPWAAIEARCSGKKVKNGGI